MRGPKRIILYLTGLLQAKISSAFNWQQDLLQGGQVSPRYVPLWEDCTLQFRGHVLGCFFPLS